jgi:hypothetical protein
MIYAVFQIQSNSLVLCAKFNSKAEAVKHAKTGFNMTIIEIYE